MGCRSGDRPDGERPMATALATSTTTTTTAADTVATGTATTTAAGAAATGTATTTAAGAAATGTVTTTAEGAGDVSATGIVTTTADSSSSRSFLSTRLCFYAAAPPTRRTRDAWDPTSLPETRAFLHVRENNRSQGHQENTTPA